jgi:hypothetical protein
MLLSFVSFLVMIASGFGVVREAIALASPSVREAGPEVGFIPFDVAFEGINQVIFVDLDRLADSH